jgi:hypothetical protein
VCRCTLLAMPVTTGFNHVATLATESIFG